MKTRVLLVCTTAAPTIFGFLRLADSSQMRAAPGPSVANRTKPS